MRFDAGRTTITTAGTQLQVENVSWKVKSVSFKAPAANTGIVYIGTSTVSATDGWELSPGETLSLEFGDGSVTMSDFWADVSVSGEFVQWIVVYE